MSVPAKGPLAYIVVLVAVFAIAFGVGRAWGPESEPAPHDSPSHSVVETGVENTGPAPVQHGGEH
ncbi:hypothetical protein IA539_05195 [Gordonia sp. zg691]|uniref:Uncharacterized protein n=1 Tax=Gordonia jinghuaiqii TaxID=2758710 RepID=A0A7D7QZS6_9ACTN|nr:hypothetical protein [Gordonia jinghuaiqii]MBD0860603.1 hypothetical protein [Gordonia jinghuaiqii]MCR5978132.1 hypothetical protein [Gordonia jinghuaiqii]QMT01411.1 hypothetical protein H1R19_21750 [Gordonia jinghuaiqii]